MKKSLLLLLAFITGSICVQAQTLISSRIMEGSPSSNAHITKVYRDMSSDNVYIAGWFTNDLDIDAGPAVVTLTGTGNKSAFVAKYNYMGDYEWSLCFTSNEDSVVINDMVSDLGGDLVIVGTFNGTFITNPNDGGGASIGSNNFSGFIGKYSSASGSFIYALPFETSATGGSAITSVTLFSADIFVGGWFTNDMDADAGAPVVPYTSAFGKDAFIAHYDYSGAYVSSQQFESGTGDEKIADVHYYDGMLYTLGSFNNSFDMDVLTGTSSYTTTGGTDVFYAVYNAFDYTYMRGLKLGGTGNEKPVAVDEDHIVMDFEGSFNADPLGTTTTLTSNGASDVAMLKYDPFDATLDWGKSIGNAGPNHASFYYMDNYGYPYFDVTFNGIMDMDPNATVVNDVSTNTPVNAVVVELNDYDGTYKTHYRVEGSTCAAFLPAEDNNEIFMIGDFSGNNVDVLPYDSVALVSHTFNTALYFTIFNRCNIWNAEAFIATPYPCYSCDITIATKAVGGIPPFEVYWNTEASGEILYNMCPGSYSVSFYDYHGCYSESPYLDISDHDGYPFDAVVTPLASTCGDSLGSASATVTDNMGAITYMWSNGDTTAVADSLTAGAYTVQIMDTTGCYITEPFVINNTDGPSVTLTSTGNPNCSGANTGTINITVSGGSTPYTFLWSNGATTEDLAGVGPGTYAVIVTDATGCQNQLCATLTAPEEITVLQTSGAASSCTNNDGSIAVITFGGVEPYTYLWDAAAGLQTSDSAINLYAGMYGVTVTDANGCTATRTFGVSDGAGPTVYLNDLYDASCYYGPGYIDIGVWGSGSYNYLWSNGFTTEDAYNIYGGEYLAVVTDNTTGCKTTFSYDLYQEPPFTPYVCMVTVDSTGTKNVVVWDKTTTPEAAYYKIYREGFCSSDDFLPVGSVLQDSLSIFEDTVVNTVTRSWRYYVTAVDSCGYESDPSPVNKTIHLVAAYNNTDETIELNWESYIGMEIDHYDIYRVDETDSTSYILIDSVNAITLNYTDDDDFSGYTFDIEYFVEAVPVNPCYASRAFNQNASRSNHSRVGLAAIPNDTTGISSNMPIEQLIKVYPNPANDRLNIRVSRSEVSYQATLMNHVGQSIRTFEVNNNTTISTRELQQGIYYLRLVGPDQQNKTFKLVIAH